MLKDDKNVDRDLFFREPDPFNVNNEIECFISRDHGRYYGSIELLKVNGEKLSPPPRIFGTPKLEFPFDRNMNYIFPSADEILTYRKYDGTNIFMYRYPDATGILYTSYKVRLFPFLRRHFPSLWRRMLAAYPDLPKLFLANQERYPDISGFSFEMYGADNPHLIRYFKPLDIVLLFAIRGNGEIIPHHELDTMDVPCARTYNLSGPGSHRINSDYVWYYEQQKQYFTDTLETVPQDEIQNDELVQFDGDEGSVWYLKEKRTGLWRMYKCKANQIQAIHWEKRSVPEIVIQATAQNALETHDVLTDKIIVNLLKEEFTEHAIAASELRIAKVVAIMNGKLELDGRIKSLMRDLDPNLELPDMMRALSKHFAKSDIRKVFTRIKLMRDRG